MSKQIHNYDPSERFRTLAPEHRHDWQMFKSGRYPEYRCSKCEADDRDVDHLSECPNDYDAFATLFIGQG